MKRSLFALALMCCIFACSDQDAIVPTPTFTNSPTSVYYLQDFVDGQLLHRYYFFDLNHKETKNKKYFVAEFMYQTRDTMKVIVSPRSIDSLALDFPADIMDYPGYGWAGQWTNPSFLLKRTYEDEPKFYKDFIPSDPTSNLYFLNSPAYVESMAGKWPNAYLSQVRIPDGTGNHSKYEFYFYFKHGLSYSREIFFPAGDEDKAVFHNYSIGAIDKITPIAYDWETVASAFSSSHSYGYFFPQHYFIDFKKWQYFVWTEGCDKLTGACANRTIQFGDYKDLDKLLKWPEGWVKP